MLRVFDSIGSTNDYIKENYEELEHFHCVMAYRQTAGKGRRGRTWESQQDSLNLSILLKERDYEGRFFPIDSGVSLLAALSVCGVLEKSADIKAQIKWPNDILINYKKVCGILLENIIGGENNNCVIIGIGVNVNNLCFPDEIKDKATSLKLETGIDTDLSQMAKRVIDEVKARLNYSRDEIIRAYGERCITIGKRICSSNNLWGICQSVGEDGSLIVKTDDGSKVVLYAGEVSIRTEGGYV